MDAPKEFDGDKVAEVVNHKVTMQEYADMYHVYVAMDKNGSVWYFSNEPVRHNVAWGISTEGTFDSITDIVQKPDCDWKDSLCEPHKETVAETVSRAPRLYHTPCGDFTEGERVITGCDDERIFYSYDANLKEPYSCVVGWCEEEYKNGEKFTIATWDKIEKIPQKKYKAYDKPSLEWLEKTIVDKSRDCMAIIGFVGKNSIKTEEYDEISFDKLYNDYTWVDGSVCGQEVE